MQVGAANRLGSVGIPEVEVLDVDPVIVAGRLAVVTVWVRVCGAQAAVRVRMVVLLRAVFDIHHQNLGSSAPPAANEPIRLVDDEKNIRRTLRMVLESEGHIVHEAGNAAEAQAFLVRFDAIFDVLKPSAHEGDMSDADVEALIAE